MQLLTKSTEKESSRNRNIFSWTFFVVKERLHVLSQTFLRELGFTIRFSTQIMQHLFVIKVSEPYITIITLQSLRKFFFTPCLTIAVTMNTDKVIL